MTDQPQHVCAGISYDTVGSDLCYELNSGETTPKDLREFLHADLDTQSAELALGADLKILEGIDIEIG